MPETPSSPRGYQHLRPPCLADDDIRDERNVRGSIMHFLQWAERKHAKHTVEFIRWRMELEGKRKDRVTPTLSKDILQVFYL